LTPSWWYDDLCQYGLLKHLSINEKGTFIDGLKISSVTVGELALDSRSEMSLRLSVPDEAEHCGGLTLFGKGFGNYNQGIRIKVRWKE